MTLQKLFLTAIASVAFSAGAALAAPPDRGHDRDRHEPQHDARGAMGSAMRGAMGLNRDQQWKDNRGTVHNDHDRYWQPQYRGYVAQDRVFAALRGRGYARFNGTPYWFQGRYVVKSFDRSGRPIFVEINPYTGAFVGVVRF